MSSATASRHSDIAQDVMTNPCGLASPDLVALRRRISRRSSPSRSARSSICASTANVDSRFPYPRMDPEYGLFVYAMVVSKRTFGHRYSPATVDSMTYGVVEPQDT